MHTIRTRRTSKFAFCLWRLLILLHHNRHLPFFGCMASSSAQSPHSQLSSRNLMMEVMETATTAAAAATVPTPLSYQSTPGESTRIIINGGGSNHPPIPLPSPHPTTNSTNYRVGTNEDSEETSSSWARDASIHTGTRGSISVIQPAMIAAIQEDVARPSREYVLQRLSEALMRRSLTQVG
jgi:hypothetical protein